MRGGLTVGEVYLGTLLLEGSSEECGTITIRILNFETGITSDLKETVSRCASFLCLTVLCHNFFFFFCDDSDD